MDGFRLTWLLLHQAYRKCYALQGQLGVHQEGIHRVEKVRKTPKVVNAAYFFVENMGLPKLWACGIVMDYFQGVPGCKY